MKDLLLIMCLIQVLELSPCLLVGKVMLIWSYIIFYTGTTRNHFEGIIMGLSFRVRYVHLYRVVDCNDIYNSHCYISGKIVLQLEYEAYHSMARKQLSDICDRVRQQWAIYKMAIVHRVG